jgi:hypothetical protein
MTVFEYMIGNKEWFIPPRHNVIVVQPNDTLQRPLVVPYDFDFSSFVNADYTKPKGVPDSLLASRRDYKGPCFSEQEFSVIFDRFRALRPQFEKVIMDHHVLSKSYRKLHIDYLDQFYGIIRNRESFKTEFTDSCESKSDYNYVD